MEVLGVASILPFMQLVAEPNAIEQSSWLTWIYEYFEFVDERQMLIYFGVTIIVLITVTNLFSVLTIWLQYRYIWDIAHRISTRLLAMYLDKPYRFFLTTNTSKLRAYIISEVNGLTGGIILPIIELCSKLFISFTIFALLLFVDVKISLIMFGGLGGAYLLIYLAQRNVLKRIGEHRLQMNWMRYKSIQELLDGIKTVMVYNQQKFFYNRYSYASREFCDVQPKYSVLLAMPKSVLEILAFGGILSVTVYLYIYYGNVQSTLPRLSLYAVAGYRLLPALQKSFSAAAKLRHSFPVFESMKEDLLASLEYQDKENKPSHPLVLRENLELNNIDFKYENSNQAVIKSLSLDIASGQTIAFVGSTGSGKTTLVDMIVGLLHPVKGSIAVDGQPLKRQNIEAWRDTLSYVPQDVFLFDDTVLRNIVMGTEEEDIDYEHLNTVTKTADIFDFITDELPQGFQTKVGERGVRLSGGQRQRLGLARALYFSPSVLVLDEATSALDSITEKGIIESLKALPRDITTIIIAHRLSTVRHADKIYILEKGAIIAEGTYHSLVNSNETFRAMVQLS